MVLSDDDFGDDAVVLASLACLMAWRSWMWWRSCGHPRFGSHGLDRIARLGRIASDSSLTGSNET